MPRVVILLQDEGWFSRLQPRLYHRLKNLVYIRALRHLAIFVRVNLIANELRFKVVPNSCPGVDFVELSLLIRWLIFVLNTGVAVALSRLAYNVDPALRSYRKVDLI